MSSQSQNDTAKHFRTLHVPGKPLMLTNVWDAITANTIASLPGTKALATASFAIAAAAGLSDDDLDLDTNLRAVRIIAKVAAAHSLPLSVDFQDGFGADLEDGVRAVIELGAVGINLEDFGRETDGLYSTEAQCERIRKVLAVAREQGVPDFVVNARTDALFAGRDVDEAIQRGTAYLGAGAFNVFIWGGPTRQGWKREEVRRASEALGGRLNVILIRGKTGGLSVSEIGELGVARISVGPALMRWSAERIGEEAERILEKA
ncbi:Phosphoenolpyruvate/pyruvate domain-containing protein [Didymella exigua CBS 183.55]|uniref:Phosphoenolpyruvate/pyruvate domain-containing protein n=1 Tax=Didymella exigua CBS 183.55 TaxID=1150837 RepID=A0A6A5RAH0_9PLEO|nr:Phosphoenolpyruvate/pyruvate domain-containing protein [Didymella exigua CBS 183.55]KAF1924310.1 Phosphoenolpyruvate/pyruvate domain-containing protein [Didymella exigua CBS 183.55]